MGVASGAFKFHSKLGWSLRSRISRKRSSFYRSAEDALPPSAAISPMPSGFDVGPESEAPLPEGDTRIVQRFNVGIYVERTKSPERTAETLGPRI